MNPEQVLLLNQLKKMIFIKSQDKDFIPIHLGVDWTTATLWCHKMVDKDIRKIFIGEAIRATQTKNDDWNRDNKVSSEFRYKSNKGLYLWATTKFLLFQHHGKASLNFSFIQRMGLIERLVKKLNTQAFLERIDLIDPIDYGISRIDVQITAIVKDPINFFVIPFLYNYNFSSKFRIYGETHKKRGTSFTGMSFKGDDFLLRIYDKTGEVNKETDLDKKAMMENRLSPFSYCRVWRIELQLDGNLNKYKKDLMLDEDELTLKIFRDFNKRKKIDFLEKILEATEVGLPEKPRPHGWLFDQPIKFPPLL